jgi:NAD(P)-dependent dehydrogenase (short-subunit alcohol dehydrogenase family)
VPGCRDVAGRRQTAVNLDGVFLSVKHAVPAMRRAGGGSIIITSSVAGLRGSAGLAGYCATKGGVRLFAKAVAMECASDRIRVNSVHPGVIDTPIWTKLPVSAGLNVPIDPREIARAGVPLGRVGEAQDIANGVLFLASELSDYMTGTELVIDGGMTGGARSRWTADRAGLRGVDGSSSAPVSRRIMRAMSSCACGGRLRAAASA